MRIHSLLPLLRKLKNVYGPVQLLLFFRDEFALRRRLTRFRRNRNTNGSSYIHSLYGCVNNNKFRKFISRRELYIKRITKRQRLSKKRTFFRVIHLA